MFKKILVSSITLFLGLGFFVVANAHVTLNPDESEPGSYEKYDVRVPVEKDANTNKVELEVPEGVSIVAVTPVDGWEYSFDKDKDGNITKVTWSAIENGIGVNEFIEFPIIVANPEEEGKFTWKAIQFYDDGDAVEWTDTDENSENPAPTTEVKKGATTAEASSSTNSTTGLWIVSIIAILLSLVALFKKPAQNKH